jgi:hypothetical protein
MRVLNGLLASNGRQHAGGQAPGPKEPQAGVHVGPGVTVAAAYAARTLLSPPPTVVNRSRRSSISAWMIPVALTERQVKPAPAETVVLASVRPAVTTSACNWVLAPVLA